MLVRFVAALMLIGMGVSSAYAECHWYLALPCHLQNEPTPMDFAIALREMREREAYRKQLWDPHADERERAERQRQAERERAFNERCKPTEYKGEDGLIYLRYAHPECSGQLLN